jgi:PAS domain S-box-containing protein
MNGLKMTNSIIKKNRLSTPSLFAPYIILVMLLFGSVWLWQFLIKVEQTRAQNHFNEYCERISEDIVDRIHTYRKLLQSGAGIFIASEEVTREEWRTYYEYRRTRTSMLGMQAFAFAEVVRADELTQHIERIRAEGFTDYRVWPEGDRSFYTPVVFLEPFDSINREALGFDLSSEIVRQKALERARDTTQVTMSEKVRLLVGDGDEDTLTGHLLFVPFFAGGVPPSDLDARRAAIRGYVFAALRVQDIIKGIFTEAPPNIAFELYDGTTISPESLLFESIKLEGGLGKEQRARFSNQMPLDLYGHTWNLVLHSTPQFEAEKAPYLPWIVLAAGLIVSMLVFRMMRIQQNIFEQATELAEKLTIDLHESEESMRATLYSIGDAVISTDAKGLVTAMNPVAVSLTGWKESEAIGQPLTTIFHIINEHTRQPVESPAETVLKEGRIIGLANHTLLLSKDGRELSIADSGAPIRNAAGAITGVVLVFRDQTKENKIRKKLENSRQRLESMFRAAPVGIGVARAGNIRTANDMLCKITGYSHNELIGQNIQMLYASQEEFERSRFGEDSRGAMPEEGSIETVWVRKDSTNVDVLFSISPLDRNDPSKGITFTAQDITDRKRAEEDRNARRAAEEANRAKSAFLANMSHEIRTPLNAVLGFAQILERDDSLGQRQIGMVHTIARSGRHLLHLINDILDMSKIEAGRLELNPIDFCLHDLLDDVEMMFRSRAQAKQLQLLVEREDSVPRYIHADEGKLRQVLINLMSNAVKFTKLGGVSVRVKCETSTTDTPHSNEAVRLIVEVEDSGPGISNSDLESIFEPFRQSSAGRESGGTGLGLAVSSRIVEMMGGSISVKSSLNKGSCFRFSVVVKQAEGVQQEITPLTQKVVGLEPGTAIYRILIVDDQKNNRDLLIALLEPLGFEIREALNGKEALEVFETWSPHVILMDMRMPVMDGYEATRRIKLTTKGKNTPVIAVTASAFDDAEREVLAAGVDQYIRKPFRPEEMFTALQKCLGLRYAYADDTEQAQGKLEVQPLTHQELAALPAPLRQAMSQAVEEGDMTGLQLLIAEVEKTDSKVAGKLGILANQYDYATLAHLLTN